MKYYEGIQSPVKRPELVDIVIFRENTEDIYAGIEFRNEGTPEAAKLIAFVNDDMLKGTQEEDSSSTRVLASSRSRLRDPSAWCAWRLSLH